MGGGRFLSVGWGIWAGFWWGYLFWGGGLLLRAAYFTGLEGKWGMNVLEKFSRGFPSFGWLFLWYLWITGGWHFSWIPPLLSHSIFPKESSVPILWMPWGTAIFSFYPGLMWFGTPRDGNWSYKDFPRIHSLSGHRYPGGAQFPFVPPGGIHF